MLSRCVVGLLLVSAAVAQARRGPVPKPVRFLPVAGSEDATNLVVKFVEGSGVRLRGGLFVSAAGLPTAGAQAAIAGAASVERLFERDEETLDGERSALVQRLAANGAQGIDPPADLNLYFRVRMPTVPAGIAAWRALAADALVETVIADTPPGYDADPQDIPPTTPDYSQTQFHFGAAPAGIGMVEARMIPGGRGEPVQICDIETGLYVDHEDIPLAVAANVIGANPTPTFHGVAVAGEMVADKNGYGMTGGVFKAHYKFHSHQSQYWASSVNVAAANSQAGDIIVLEVQLPCPLTATSVCPMEGRQDVFDAVRNATLAGIHVVAAAGNGNQDLDNPVYGGLFDRGFRDSGAVICAATDAGQLVRAAFSNYGSIVDANGWGYQVRTTGYGDLFYPNNDVRQTYTATFSGTSSATPIVTSAAAATIGAAKFQLGKMLAPAQLRTMLQRHGASVAMIGRRPDVAALLRELRLPNDLVLQSEVQTGGTVTLHFTAKPTQVAIVLADLAGMASVLPFGRLLLNPATMVGVGVYVGSGTHLMPVPSNPLLAGTEVHWQVMRFDVSSGVITLTNSVVSHFER